MFAFIKLSRTFTVFKQNITIMKNQTELESTKSINALKAKAIKKGGYHTLRSQIVDACEKHLHLFGKDLRPKHLYS